MEILEQKIIVRDKTIERLKTELNEMNKLNLLLEEQVKENEKTIQKLSKTPKKRQYKKKKKEIIEYDGSFSLEEPEEDGTFEELETDGSFYNKEKEKKEDIGEFVLNKSDILMNPSQTYQKEHINHIIGKYNGSLNAQYEYNAKPNLLTNKQCLNIIKYMNQKINIDENTNDHKLNIKEEQLIELIGEGTFQKIISMYSGTYNTIYIRKVLGNNSLIDFHKDYSKRTMKIALNETSEYKGGDLIYLTDGKVHRPEQLQGSVTIHNNDIIHGVTPIVKGERYSLFVLYTP
jgi:hypothetical protein